MSNKNLVSTLLIGGGALGAGLLFFLAKRKSDKHVDDLRDAMMGKPVDLSSSSSVTLSPSGPQFKVHATGYWPYTASASEKKMEGGLKDRKGAAITTLEMHQRDPVKYPFVSVSGDDSIFPYGQKLLINAWPGSVFRVTDTGGHFRGAGKVFRVMGEEPLDFAVDSSKTFVPKKDVVATIIPGDNFAKGKAVATGKFTGQTVAGADVIGYAESIDVYTSDDHEALARALESELTSRPRPELEAAAWAIRNRAEVLDVSIYDLLAPRNKYGSPHETRGYASTRREPSELARMVAQEVLNGGEDPTHGAIDFWVPSHQQKMNQLGDVYWAALANNDSEKAAKYERYSSYGSIDDVRAAHQRYGLSAVQSIGLVELLRRD